VEPLQAAASGNQAVLRLLHKVGEVRLCVAPRLHKLHKIGLASLKLSIRQSPAKELVAEPHPLRVEHVALAVLGNFANVTVAKATPAYKRRLWPQRLLRSDFALFRSLAVELIFVEPQNEQPNRR
jgi:hypothetical protein